MAFCTQCGVALPDGAKFCRSCGAKVTDALAPNRAAIAADSPSAPPVVPIPHQSTRGTAQARSNKQGMRWATWCIYVSYPLGGVITLSNAVKLSHNTYGVILGAVAIFQLITWFLLLKKNKIGWYLNFVFWFVEILLQSFKSSDIVVDSVGAVIAIAIFYTPNAIYWYKRKWVFESGGDTLFPSDWRQVVPIVLVIIGIPILAAITLPAYQDYVKRTKVNNAQASVTDIVDPFDAQSSQKNQSNTRSSPPYEQRAWSGNAFDQFDSVNAIAAKAQSIPQLNEQRAWSAVIAWQKYFINSGGKEANVALYMGVDTVLEGLKLNRGVCRPGELITVDAAHASKDIPAGTQFVANDCDAPP